MRTIGLIGGLSWHSTLEYYRLVNERVAERLGGHSSARVVLESLDFAEIRDCQTTGDWERAGRLLADAGRRLELAGADVLLICANLMHRVADDVEAAVDIPLLHIADTLAARAHAHGWSRLGLVGTWWVMDEDFYADRLRAAGLTVVLPSHDDKVEIDRIVFEELTQGRVLDTSRTTYVAAIRRLQDAGSQALASACTELELLVGPGDSPLPLLESMRIHAEAAADWALGEGVSPGTR
jgi:aspartate racemase